MKLELQQTDDLSHTLYVPELDEHYHSVHGAWQESVHVFINAGFLHLNKDAEVSVLEIGFGTGLNALLTYISNNNKAQINYVGVEKFPIPDALVEQLNDSVHRAPEFSHVFTAMHLHNWNEWVQLSDSFLLYKAREDFLTFNTTRRFDLVYFDAFAPDKQPEMWSKDNFSKIFKLMRSGGVLTTYCAKGAIRRLLQEIGFEVERIPGPPGKREMLRAVRL